MISRRQRPIARSLADAMLRVMNPLFFLRMQLLLVGAGWAACSSAAPVVLDPELQIRNVINTGADSFRLVRNPEDNFLY